MQDTFVELVSAYRLTEPIAHLAAWPLRVARNRIIDRFRNKSRKMLDGVSPSAIDDGSSPDPVSILEEWRAPENAGPEANYVRNFLADELAQRSMSCRRNSARYSLRMTKRTQLQELAASRALRSIRYWDENTQRSAICASQDIRLDWAIEEYVMSDFGLRALSSLFCGVALSLLGCVVMSLWNAVLPAVTSLFNQFTFRHSGYSCCRASCSGAIEAGGAAAELPSVFMRAGKLPRRERFREVLRSRGCGRADAAGGGRRRYENIGGSVPWVAASDHSRGAVDAATPPQCRG